jgi:hypothetical protein
MRRPASFTPGRRRHAPAASTLLLAGVLAACGRDAPPAPPRASAPSATPVAPPAPTPASAAPTPAAVPAPPAAQPGEPAPLETWNAAGVTVERLPGDAIRVRGTDRWGARMDTTYADATYFANAVPVFSRGLNDDQARAMTELIPRVRAATSTPAAPAQPTAAQPTPAP